MVSMPTWEARYVRLADRAKDISRLRAQVSRMNPGAQVVDDGKSPFVAWLTGATSEALEPPDLSEISRDIGEAVALAAQTVADLILYDHFVAGDRVRGLTHAGEAGWVRVIGEPEPWEAHALFSQTKLEELKADLENELTGDALARDSAELERLWKVGRLEEGSTRPPIEPLALARALEKHFSLPSLPRK
jgi:hypothetical protein